jgi:hypothetical protein
MAQIRGPSHEDDLHDPEREEGMSLLRDDGNFFCDLRPLHLPERNSRAEDLSPLRNQEAIEDFKKGGFA